MALDVDRRVGEARHVVERLAAGDLAARCRPGSADDDIDALLRSINTLAESLSATPRHDRLDQVREFLLNMAEGRRPEPLRTSGSGDRLDAVMLGLNMLAEELDGALAMQRRLRSQALYDPLTRLPNRILLDDRLQMHRARATRDKSRIAVLFIDVDRFKSINDQFGHAVGDAVLTEIGARLRRIVRASDTVARYGGDEFVVAATVREVPDARTIVAQVVSALEPAFGGPAHELHVSASVGVAVFPDHSTDLPELIRLADAAMYEQKRNA